MGVGKDVATKKTLKMEKHIIIKSARHVQGISEENLTKGTMRKGMEEKKDDRDKDGKTA